MVNRTPYQERIIRNYYKNKDDIVLQKLGEQVTELYLAEGKARERQLKAIEKSLVALKVPATRVAHLIKQGDPAQFAKLLEELLGKQ